MKHVPPPVVLLLASLVFACTEDPVAPRETDGAAVGIVVSSVDRALTIFDVEAPEQSFSIGLAPDGSPVTLAVRGTLVAVPLGTVPALAVADLETRAVVRTVPLPEGSGATGVAFLNDSIAIVANPSLNTVTPVNVLRGTRGEDLQVGAYPQSVVAVPDTVFVLNATLGPDFNPAGPATVSVITGTPTSVVRTITLSGLNAGAGVATSDGRLIVVNAGSFGAANGSISIVSRSTLMESQHVTGFGDFPGAVAIGPNGQIHVASFSYGVAIWDPSTSAFVRAPDQAIQPGGVASASGLGFDEDGRLYTLMPECREPSRALRLTATFTVDVEIPTGICPFGIAFVRLP